MPPLTLPPPPPSVLSQPVKSNAPEATNAINANRRASEHQPIALN
jgi:hypothetical protein